MEIVAEKSSSQKLQFLHILRGVASILVVLYHTSTLYTLNLDIYFLNNIFKFAHVGVEFFFVLSGFIIYYTNYKNIGRREKLIDYLKKRFVRVYPIYWVVLIPRLLLQARPLSVGVILGSTLLLPYPNPRIVNVSWTLTYEVFFYLTFAFIIYFGFNKKVQFILLFSFLILYFVFDNSDAFFHSWHLLEFIIGICSAVLVLKYNFSTKFLYLGISLFLIFAILTVNDSYNFTTDTSISKYHRTEQYYSFYERLGFIFFGIPSALIILGGAKIKIVSTDLFMKSVVLIGDASYSIYLIHGTVINSLTKSSLSLFIKKWVFLQILVPSLAIICGIIFYTIIEKNVIKVFNNIFFKQFKKHDHIINS